MTRDELVERLAKAIFDHGEHRCTWDDLTDYWPAGEPRIRDMYRTMARAVLAASPFREPKN